MGRNSRLITKDGLVIGLRAQTLLNASPIKKDIVLKLHLPFLYKALPNFFRNKISTNPRFVEKALAPHWRERLLILGGNFLYRYVNEISSGPKGRPIGIKSIHAKILEEGCHDFDHKLLEALISSLPPGVDTLFAVTSFGKPRYFATSHNEATKWVSSINQARQDSIERYIGHSTKEYLESWKYFDILANQYVKKKQRVKGIEENERQEVSELDKNIKLLS